MKGERGASGRWRLEVGGERGAFGRWRLEVGGESAKDEGRWTKDEKKLGICEVEMWDTGAAVY